MAELYPLWPKQQLAMQYLGQGGYINSTPVEELFYGGQAGGGKSYFSRALAVGRALQYPGYVAPIFRRTYGELEETHILRIQQELPTPQLGHYNAARYSWLFPNGSILEFRHCEHENDVFKYNSAEWDDLFIDEATQFSENQITYLRSRVRTPISKRSKWGKDWHPCIVYTANPGNIGHHYFRNGFVKASRPYYPFRAPQEDGGSLRVFVPATLDDNPALSSEYRLRLQGIKDKALRRALLEGDWDVFAGQVFSEFREARHVIRPFTIPAHWHKWRAYDYGYSAPMCVLWFAREPDTRRVFIYRELYATGLTDVQQVGRINTLSRNEQIRTTYADPALWTKNPNGTSIAQVFANYNLFLTRASNDRLSGIQRVHEYLYIPPDQPHGQLMIFDSCVNLIRTLPALTYDATHVEDVDTDQEDHAYDSLRYGLMGESTARRNQIQIGTFRVVA